METTKQHEIYEYDDALECIKLQFIDDYENGRKPTLHDYATRHPEYAGEIIEFVIWFLRLFGRGWDGW
jgi:hypothetical protein